MMRLTVISGTRKTRRSVPTQGQQIDTGIITVASGDYFEMVVFQGSGVTLDLEDEQCWFQLEVIE